MDFLSICWFFFSVLRSRCRCDHVGNIWTYFLKLGCIHMYSLRSGAVPNILSVSFHVTGCFLSTGCDDTKEERVVAFRQTASGLGSIVGRIGGLMAPLVNILAMYHPSLPTIVFGSLSIISGSLGFLLPETRRKELPESIHEAENGYVAHNTLVKHPGCCASGSVSQSLVHHLHLDIFLPELS